MFTSTNAVIFTVIGVCLLLAAITIVTLLACYRRSAPDELLIVFGKSGKQKIKDKDGKEIEVVTPSKILNGGGTFVWPIIQEYKKMSMAPLQIKVTVDGIDSQAIQMHLPVVLTTAISRDKAIQQNAAIRFLSASPSEIQKQLSEILIGETRAIMATMLIEDINADRDTFLGKVRGSLEQELAKVGYDVTNINISEITDDADYITNLGKKAATKAQANAEADIAEQRKQGNVKIAETKKEEAIAVAEAQYKQQVKVNETKKMQDVEVATINRDKEIQLAEAEKEKESGIATQNAEKVANIANANAEAESKKAEAQAKQIAAVAEAAADAESKKAEAEARQVSAVAKAESQAESNKAAAEAEKKKNVAQSLADAEAAENEAIAKKQIRVNIAKQEQEAETIKATQEKEAKAAQYESEKRQKKAEQDKLAGVAEQEAKIDVASATARAGKAEAEAVKVTETARVEADMSVAKIRQERQLEVNKAQAAAEAEMLNATEIVPAQKAKEKVVIEAEAIRDKAILEAEAEKQRILKQAEADAKAVQMKLEAEAEGTRQKLLAEAEGAKALALAKAEGIQQEALAPAMAFERMIQAAGSPDMAVQWKMADKWDAIIAAQSGILEHVQLGNVTVYGDSNTGAEFAKSFIKNFAPAIDMVNGGIKDKIASLFGKNQPQIEQTKPEE